MFVLVRFELHTSIPRLLHNSPTTNLVPLLPAATVHRFRQKIHQSQGSLFIVEHQSTGDKNGYRLRDMFIELLSCPFQKMTSAVLLKEPTS